MALLTACLWVSPLLCPQSWCERCAQEALTGVRPQRRAAPVQRLGVAGNPVLATGSPHNPSSSLTLRRPLSSFVCVWCCVCTLPIFLGNLPGFAFLLSDARFQRGALARSILCAQHGHSVGSPSGLSTRAEAPSSSHSADEEPRLRQAESAAAIGSTGPGTHCLPRHRLPDPIPLGLGSWSLRSWLTLFSRLCQSESGCWAPGAAWDG